MRSCSARPSFSGEAGRRPYIIPEGASNALGAWGYIRAAEELVADIAGLPGDSGRPVTILHATGSGGTAAGLILGAKLHGLKARVASINVCDDRNYFLSVIGDICEGAIADYNLKLPFTKERDIDIIDGYVGRGYALSRPEELGPDRQRSPAPRVSSWIRFTPARLSSV